MDNRLRREIAARAQDMLVEMDYAEDDINRLIDDAYDALTDAIDLLMIILDEEED